MNTSTIVQKLWNYCNVLRDDAMSYGDYVEQLAPTLTLPRRRGREIVLEALGNQKGLLGLIFNKSQKKYS